MGRIDHILMQNKYLDYLKRCERRGKTAKDWKKFKEREERKEKVRKNVHWCIGFAALSCLLIASIIYVVGALLIILS